MDMMHMEAASGTFWGHAVPGSMFVAWALYWAFQGSWHASDGTPALERTGFFPVLKVLLAVFGVWLEIPGEGWYPQDVMMSWQHVTMYSVFGLSGGVDLLARRGLLSAQATFIAYAAAMLNSGLLFWGHSSHGGVEGLIHAILAVVFFTVAGLAVVETLRPSPGLRWGRIGVQLTLGFWFISGAWIIYRSGWDLADPVRSGWAYMIFSWTATGAAVLTLGILLLTRKRSTP